MLLTHMRNFRPILLRVFLSAKSMGVYQAFTSLSDTSRVMLGKSAGMRGQNTREGGREGGNDATCISVISVTTSNSLMHKMRIVKHLNFHHTKAIAKGQSTIIDEFLVT